MAASVRNPFGPRIRFNWGYWDAYGDAINHLRDRRYIKLGSLFALPQNPAYCAGYDYGFAQGKAGESSTSSTPAWRAWNAGLVVVA